MTGNNNDNWRYASNTATMLMQTIAHINLSMHEGDASIGTVIKTFNTMGEYMDAIGDGLQEVGKEKPELAENLAYVRNHISEAIISMQFYDALTQRLQTVSKGLLAMSELLDSPERRNEESAWGELQEQMLANCSIHADTVFLQAIAEGKGFEEAHRLSTASRQEVADEIELF